LLIRSYNGKFCDALRAFLAAFRLPGEAQKIDRLVEAFARELYRAATTPAKDAQPPLPGATPEPPVPGSTWWMCDG
jgi:hypothetical protein